MALQIKREPHIYNRVIGEKLDVFYNHDQWCVHNATQRFCAVCFCAHQSEQLNSLGKREEWRRENKNIAGRKKS